MGRLDPQSDHEEAKVKVLKLFRAYDPMHKDDDWSHIGYFSNKEDAAQCSYDKNPRCKVVDVTIVVFDSVAEFIQASERKEIEDALEKLTDREKELLSSHFKSRLP
jgi:hypothetical protein